MIPQSVYILCAATSLLCAALLARAYRRTPSRLLLWSAVCFAALAFSNIMLVVDLIITGSDTDLRLWRQVPAVIGLVLMVWALATQRD